MATIEFLGGAGTVTGSKFLVEAAGRRLLVDYGLQDGAKTLRMLGEEVRVRAHVETVHGLSAHADADGLLRWLRTATRPPKRVRIVHGDPEPAKALAAQVTGELGWPATVPAYRDHLALD